MRRENVRIIVYSRSERRTNGGTGTVHPTRTTPLPSGQGAARLRKVRLDLVAGQGGRAATPGRLCHRHHPHPIHHHGSRGGANMCSRAHKIVLTVYYPLLLGGRGHYV